MKQLQSDRAENTLYLTLAGEVNAADLNRLERDALTAARVLDREFTLVTDASECERVSVLAAERVHEAVARLPPFGLAKEVRVFSSETPDHVRQTMERAEATWEIETRQRRAQNQTADIPSQ